MKRHIFFIIFLACFGTSFSQADKVADQDSQPMIDVEFVNWVDRVDSLVNIHFYYRPDTLVYGEIHRDSIIRELPDSIYRERIAAIHSPVELSYNDQVRRNLDFYIKRAYRQIPRLLALSSYYFPMFEEIFDQYGLPYELKYLAVIESALNPEAVSRVGATGLWQFMYATGKMQGLEINSYVDERRDPIASTHAACQFLQSLYGVYDDWMLVLAAYNCGPGNVNRAIIRAGGKDNFWDIYHYLPRETRNYVPAFITVNYIFEYYDQHGFVAEEIDLFGLVDTVHINHDMHFDQIAACVNISKEDLRFLNPQYKRDLIPAKNKTRHLILPVEIIADFVQIEDSIHLYKDSIYLNPAKIAYSPTASSAGTYPAASQPAGTKSLTYTIKPGDAIGLIASWYDVGLSELKAWNGLYSNTIRAGAKLTIYVPAAKAASYEMVDKMSKAAKQKREGVHPETGKALPEPLDPNYEYYTVRSGDNPWIIAQKYPGINANDILTLNGIKSASSLKVGQKLKIRKKN
ncbi:MAG: transglycosylase SLT domain-containing protein [Bacteroidales bacterium]|jgi:membrane-bound lytic murein transglycosylase D|nr:transglycosylase SLT domain-containing protein [Bacteroidales bacterium]